MTSIFDYLSRLYWRLRESAHFERIARRWRLQGHPLPFVGAMHEVQLRGELEAFRDFASARVLAGHSLLDDIREEWLKALKGRASLPGSLQDAAVLAAAIRGMPASEMLHADAYSVWRWRFKPIKPFSLSHVSEHQRRVLRS